MDSGPDAEVTAHLLKFVEQTTEFVGCPTRGGRILYLNPAAQKRIGVVEIEGLSLVDLFPPEAFGLLTTTSCARSCCARAHGAARSW